jgi:hypothetical protein
MRITRDTEQTDSLIALIVHGTTHLHTVEKVKIKMISFGALSILLPCHCNTIDLNTELKAFCVS